MGARCEVQERNRPHEAEVVWLRFASRGSSLAPAGLCRGSRAPRGDGSPTKSLALPKGVV